jgi:hypothetical protein
MLSLVSVGAIAWAGGRRAGAQQADEIDLTFFGWSDQHVGTKGQGDHLLPAIDAMNELPGKAYPAEIGGEVARPAFVLGAGDITDWPTRAARDRYDELITKRLKFPAYDLMGNHDTGGKVRSKTIEEYLVKRHGGLSYTFSSGGVHFICAYSEFDDAIENPAQPITKEALDYVRAQIAKVPPGRPIVVVFHLCLDAITNPKDVAAALEGGRVVMVLGGHYHKASVRMLDKIPFVQLPSPDPKFPPEVSVIRITSRRRLVMPYDYKAKKWATDAGKILDSRD